MKKKFRQIHLWLSVPFGIIISILCLSGAALVFENEITEALNHDFYYVENVGSTPLPAGELAKKVAATLPTVYRSQVSVSRPIRQGPIKSTFPSPDGHLYTSIRIQEK